MTEVPVKFLSTNEVAGLLSVPESTVRYWRHLGTGPQAVKFGKSIRYRADEVERWIKEQEAHSEAS